MNRDTGGAFKSVDLGAIFSDYAYMPGAVATVHVSGLGHDLLALGSYVNQDFATGQKSISLWDLQNGAPAKLASWNLPALFANPSQGAFKIIAGDFRSTGHDDLVVLLESVDLSQNYQRSWVYLAYDPQNGFSDMTAKTLGSYQAPSSLDVIKVADVNNDGHPDLIGFTSDSSAFAGNRQILLNDGLGHFSWMDTKSISSDHAVFIPRLKEDASGGLSDLQGFFKLALTANNAASIDYQALTSTIGTGPHAIDPATKGAPGFNEIFYLANHSDAATAIASGQYADGLDHYLKAGKALGYQTHAPGTIVTGTAGLDTVVYGDNRSSCDIAKTSLGYTVAASAGSTAADTLTNIERIRFADTCVALDISGNAGQAFRLYQAAFNRVPDKPGLGLWIDQMDKGMSLTAVARLFEGSAEFVSLYGANVSNTGLVTHLYNNVLHRDPETGAIPFWVHILDSGQQSRETILANFSEGAENQAQVIGAIQNGIDYVYFG